MRRESCGPFTTKFCTGIDNQSVSSNMEKIHQINDVIDSDVIILRNIAKKTVKKYILKSLLLLHLLFNPTETLQKH